MSNKKKINLSDDLIKSATTYLESLPKTPEAVVERWAYLGMAVEKQLTEVELLQVMAGSANLKVLLLDG